MNKKTNTLFFILAGTIFNIIVTMFCFIIFLIIYSKFIYSRLGEGVNTWILPVFFAAAIVASFFIYRLAIKIVMKKMDVDKYFDPIFRKRR